MTNNKKGRAEALFERTKYLLNEVLIVNSDDENLPEAMQAFAGNKSEAIKAICNAARQKAEQEGLNMRPAARHTATCTVGSLTLTLTAIPEIAKEAHTQFTAMGYINMLFAATGIVLLGVFTKQHLGRQNLIDRLQEGGEELLHEQKGAQLKGLM